MFCILVDNFRHMIFSYVFLLYTILIINKEILIILSSLSIAATVFAIQRNSAIRQVRTHKYR